MAMTESIVVLTEQPLVEADVQNLAGFHPGREIEFLLLVPHDTERRLLIDFLDNLSLLNLSKAFRELLAQSPDEDESRLAATETLNQSVQAMRAAGLGVLGEVISGDPVKALVAKVSQVEAREAIVITRPHAVEDTFHTDWASKAQQELGLPVLHLYSGSGFIGDS